jgi:hypothetical protein
MRYRLTNLRGGTVHPNGELVDRQGQPTGLRVTRSSHQIIDEQGKVVGSITLSGSVYDRDGLLAATVIRRDC